MKLNFTFFAGLVFTQYINGLVLLLCTADFVIRIGFTDEIPLAGKWYSTDALSFSAGKTSRTDTPLLQNTPAKPEPLSDGQTDPPRQRSPPQNNPFAIFKHVHHTLNTNYP